MVEVTPSLLSLPNYKSSEKLTGLVQRVHVDVMDGVFVKENTLKKFDAKKIASWNFFKKDIHLMVEKPEKFVVKYAKNSRLIWFHVEATKNPFKVIYEIKKRGLLAGIAVNPETNVRDFASLLNYVDSVLIMSVQPGKGGQKFIWEVTEKIKVVRSVFSGEICVDGGINDKTGKACVKAGANCLVAGTFIFKENAVSNTKKLLRT